MNMTPVAQAVQRQGRGNDSMLVHMTPREVGGLQALAMAHGGSLTINPETGLPEAGFLENILPTLLGVGLSFIPGVGPMMAAGLVGGGTALATGDIGKGFMAGLGAFGGANLASGLGAAGASSAAPSATAGSALPSAAGPTVTLPGTGDVSLLQSFSGPQAGTTTAGLIDGGLSATGGSGVSAGLPPQTFASNAAQAGRGFQNLITGQPGSFDKFIGTAATKTAPATGLGGTMGAAKTAGSVISPMLTPEPYKPPKGEKSTYEGPYVPTPRDVRFPTAEERQGLGTSEFQYFSNVNPVPGFQPLSATTPTTSGLSAPVATPMMTEEELRRIASLSTPMRMKDGGVPMLEDGGFVLTKKAVDGLGKGSNKKGQENARRGLGAIPIKGAGAKRGPKAGVDDKIKTTIEGKRPALVSNGEAYVPKKQVAKQGGAKAFYALMNKAEKAADKRKRA
jgi:hypothetical protein